MHLSTHTHYGINQSRQTTVARQETCHPRDSVRKTAPKGFTLPEVILGILILVGGTVASLNLIISAIRLATQNYNQIIANNLAREGFELIRHQRDTNWLTYSGKPREFWDSYPEEKNIVNYIDNSNHYYVVNLDPTDFSVQIESLGTADTALTRLDDIADSANVPPLKFSGATGVYSYSDGSETPFYRVVGIQYVDPGNPSNVSVTQTSEIEVRSLVVWHEGVGIRSVEVIGYLTDWFNQENTL